MRHPWGTFSSLARRASHQWGTTAAERALPFPCDVLALVADSVQGRSNLERMATSVRPQPVRDVLQLHAWNEEDHPNRVCSPDGEQG